MLHPLNLHTFQIPIFALFCDYRIMVNTFSGVGKPAIDAACAVYVFPIVLPALTLGCTTVKLFDTLGIKSQLRWVGIFLYFVIICVLINITIFSFGKWRILITYVIVLITTIFIGLRMVYVKQLDFYLMNRKRLNSADNQKQSVLDSFQKLWRDAKLFELFANYAVTEYSIETLLFLLEYSQFRELVIQNHSDLIEDTQQRAKFLQVLKQQREKQHFMVPSIAHDILNCDKLNRSLQIVDCIKLFQYLFDHYIDEDSVTTVNISGTVRKRIIKACTKHNLVSKQKSKAKTRRQVQMIVIHDAFQHSNDNKDGSQLQMMEESSSSKRFGMSRILSLERNKIDIDIEFPNTTSAQSLSGNAIDHNVCVLITEIMHAFEMAQTELYQLLYRDSWPRFKRTTPYKQYLAEESKEV